MRVIQVFIFCLLVLIFSVQVVLASSTAEIIVQLEIIDNELSDPAIQYIINNFDLNIPVVFEEQIIDGIEVVSVISKDAGDTYILTTF